MRFAPVLALLTLVTLSSPSSFAKDEIDASTPCESAYDKCLNKCDQEDDPSASCIIACEQAYDGCLEKTENQTED